MIQLKVQVTLPLKGRDQPFGGVPTNTTDIDMLSPPTSALLRSYEAQSASFIEKTIEFVTLITCLFIGIARKM